MRQESVTLRESVIPSDAEAVRRITLSSGFFNPAEVGVAVELVEDSLMHGERSPYRFLFAERGGEMVGYTCWGHIDGTVASFDLYWIAILEKERRVGLGRRLMAETEQRIAHLASGARVYAETSSREQYAPTRAFYENCGYRAEAVITDFYAPGDSKVIYVKLLP